MLTSEESDELDEAAWSPLQPKIKLEYPTEPTKDSEKNWTEGSDQVSEAASCPEFLQQIRLEQNRPEKSVKIGDAACPNVKLEYTGNAVESTNGFEQIWLEENYVIDEIQKLQNANEKRVAPTVIERVRAFILRQRLKKRDIGEKRAPLTGAERSKAYRLRKKLKNSDEKLSEKRAPLTDVERSRAYRIRQKLKNSDEKLSEKRAPLTGVERSKAYRIRKKT